MTNLLMDWNAKENPLISWGEDVINGEVRRYYSMKVTNSVAVVVVRGGHSIDSLRGQVVDAKVGEEIGTPGFVPEEFIGLRVLKLTVFRPIRGAVNGVIKLSKLRLP